jgi:hypothetical protein
MTAGFYKKQEDNQILYAPNWVEGLDISLVAQNKDQYEYPVDGWSWFESEEEARLFFETSIEE